MLGNVVTKIRLALSRLARNRLYAFWFADYHTAPLIIWIYLNNKRREKELVKLYACVPCALRTPRFLLLLFTLFPIAITIELNLAPKPFFFFLVCILLFVNLIWKFRTKKQQISTMKLETRQMFVAASECFNYLYTFMKLERKAIVFHGCRWPCSCWLAKSLNPLIKNIQRYHCDWGVCCAPFDCEIMVTFLFLHVSPVPGWTV